VWMVVKQKDSKKSGRGDDNPAILISFSVKAVPSRTLAPPLGSRQVFWGGPFHLPAMTAVTGVLGRQRFSSRYHPRTHGNGALEHSLPCFSSESCAFQPLPLCRLSFVRHEAVSWVPMCPPQPRDAMSENHREAVYSRKQSKAWSDQRSIGRLRTGRPALAET
jgi:hypothetical protein